MQTLGDLEPINHSGLRGEEWSAVDGEDGDAEREKFSHRCPAQHVRSLGKKGMRTGCLGPLKHSWSLVTTSKHTQSLRI